MGSPSSADVDEEARHRAGVAVADRDVAGDFEAVFDHDVEERVAFFGEALVGLEDGGEEFCGGEFGALGDGGEEDAEGGCGGGSVGSVGAEEGVEAEGSAGLSVGDLVGLEEGGEDCEVEVGGCGGGVEDCRGEMVDGWGGDSRLRR